MSSSKDVEANLGAHDGFQNNSCTVTVTVDAVPKTSKYLIDAYILLVPLGLFGAHHFYLRRPGWGFLYLFTFGLCGIGWLFDIFRMPYLVQKANNDAMYTELQKPKSYDLLDVWVLGLCPITGILGFHHYYLGRTDWGVLYTFTGGLFLLGWFFDNIRMPLLVKRANTKTHRNSEEEEIQGNDQCERQIPFIGYYLDDVYVMAFNPLGLLGLHHFYLKRCGWGTLYFLTMGVFGVGWLVDLIRMRMLVDRKNSEIYNRRSHAVYSHHGVPNYGTTTLPPEPQYQLPQHDPYHGPPPGACDYRPSLLNYQGGPGHQQQPPVYHQPPGNKDELPMKAGASEYPQPTNPGFPSAQYGNHPPPYSG